jgi:hypothetical protein
MKKFLLLTFVLTFALLSFQHSAFSQEYIDCSGGGCEAYSKRQGMHTCRDNYYMTGIHVDKGQFLCNKLGNGYNPSEEIVEKSNRVLDMRACRSGYAMTGHHKDYGLILCAPLRDGTESGRPYRDCSDLSICEDYNIRRGMHACRENRAMVGVHIERGQIACMPE